MFWIFKIGISHQKWAVFL